MAQGASVRLLWKTSSSAIAQRLQQLGAQALQAAQVALKREGDRIMAVSVERTPIDTGALRGSSIVLPPEVQGTKVVVELKVGGIAAPYAIYVHERLDLHHPIGQAKFLESALREAMSGMAERLAADLRIGR